MSRNDNIKKELKNVIENLNKIEKQNITAKINIAIQELENINNHIRESKKEEEIRAGYMGPQVNRSNNRWISSLRHPFMY